MNKDASDTTEPQADEPKPSETKVESDDEMAKKKKKSRAAQAAQMDIKQRLLRDLRKIYQEKNGITDMATLIGDEDLKIDVPREKVTVMIIGNHSAGKSSFINWYIDEEIQKESYAMETAGFTIVTSGNKRETLKGRATTQTASYIKGITQFEGARDYLSMEICASKARCFPMCDFIDTPGLTDGNLKYPFDVNKVICHLADVVDQIFVFFDPHGQATISRTVDVVRELIRSNYQKTRFFLSKADDIDGELQRGQVMSQLSQSLGRVTESKEQLYALKVRPIYRPKVGIDESELTDTNYIAELCEDIEKLVAGKLQDHITGLQDTAADMETRVRTHLDRHQKDTDTAKTMNMISWLSLLLAFLIPSSCCSYLLHALVYVLPAKFVPYGPSSWAAWLRMLDYPLRYAEESENKLYVLGGLLVGCAVLYYGAKLLRAHIRKLNIRPDSEVGQLRVAKRKLHELARQGGTCDDMLKAYIADHM